MTSVLCVPQWQGSASQRARLLVDGAVRSAELVAGDLTGTVTVPVVDGTVEITDGVRAYDALVENQRLIAEAHAGIDDFVITVGGECAVDLAPIAAARKRYGDALRVLWIDAHPDVWGPGELPSGAFHGMVVRTLLGDGPRRLTPAEVLEPEQVILAGVRAPGDPERDYLARTPGLRVYKELRTAVQQLDGPTYVHIDLDVLEPAEFGSVCYPEPNGLRPADLIEVVSRLTDVIGAAITEHAPATTVPTEATVIRNLGKALAPS